MKENPPKKPIDKISKEDLEFIDDSRKTVNNEPPILNNLIFYAMGLFILIFIIWAKFAVLDEITVAPGKVVPSTQVQVIQSLDGGTIAAIYVKEGDKVKKGQVVVRLDDTLNAAAYNESLAKYWALLASTSRLYAEESGLSTVTYPKALLENQPDLANNQTSLFNQHMAALNNKLNTLRRSYILVDKELELSRPLLKEGLISETDFLHTQRKVNELQGKIGQAIESFQSTAHDQLIKQNAQLASLKEKLTGLKDRIVRSSLRSPVYGIVKRININTIGGVAEPGMEIIEIVPLEDTLLIEARVSPKDIAFIRPNQSAMVKFTAYDYSIYGGLSGIVEYISADTIKDEDHPQNPEMYYKILVRTNSNHLGTNKDPLPIIPGMTVTVDIKTGRKSILDTLLSPILNVKQNALRER